MTSGDNSVRRFAVERDHPRYKWVALSNTTLGVLMATVNSSIVIISLPDIFRGIKLDPLRPGNVSYLLWMLMGFLVVTAVLVVTLGRLGDIYGRVKIYNLGFLVFTIGSVALVFDPLTQGAGALWLILWRVVQGVGAAMLFANSTAILTDAFPADRRGFALGINQVAAIGGSFIGLIVGGVLAPVDWRLVFFVSVPFGLLGTVWSYHSLRETSTRSAARIDWWGNALFAVGVTAILVAITYGIQPYGGHEMGWTSPWVLGGLIAGLVLLVAFCLVEARTTDPMFDMSLFRIQAFSAGNLAGLLSSISRGGLQFMLIIWLQGIWLPLHGYSFESTPLWAGIYLLPLTVAFLIAGPLSGYFSDRLGARTLATGGLVLVAVSFAGLMVLPTDFSYWAFAGLLVLNGIGSGLFSAPNTTAIMNSVPANRRGAASGMRGTFLNSGTSLSIGVFFTMMIAGLAATLPRTLTDGLHAHGVPLNVAAGIGNQPPVGSLFAAFLGYNPIGTALNAVPASAIKGADLGTLTSKQFFPELISGPFHHGLVIVFAVAIGMSLVGAAASLFRGPRYIHTEPEDARLPATAVQP
ncbi:MFS transporter [Kribbella sp.]|uniref:MFS transporter n=1 Tax=Kribbella sp. TaxID=1871183 RepID=UPI002D4149BF|nr:MFS transporter [Kribbella sp.]HZX03944.1 MFS transporter [Kribbella sp.]